MHSLALLSERREQEKADKNERVFSKLLFALLIRPCQQFASFWLRNSLKTSSSTCGFRQHWGVIVRETTARFTCTSAISPHRPQRGEGAGEDHKYICGSVYGERRRQWSRRQRRMEAEIDKDRYSNVSFVNFYHKFSQSVSVNQTHCPIPSVEIP